MPSGEMTITLDDVSCLLHIPVDGRMLHHILPTGKDEGVRWMVEMLGSTEREALDEVKKTKGAHCRFVYLRRLIERHIKTTKQAENDKDEENFEKYQEYIVRAYMMLLVGTTIFSNKAKNYVDLKFLPYFRELDLAWVYDHFQNIGTLSSKYSQELPRCCKYLPPKGQSDQGAMRIMMDRLLPHDIIWMPYDDHRSVRPFETCSIYSGWIRCGPAKVPYLSERVLRQFGHVQEIPRHPNTRLDHLATLDQISDHWTLLVGHILTPELLGREVAYASEASRDYMEWYVRHSHPHIIRIPNEAYLSGGAFQSMEVHRLRGVLSVVRDKNYKVR
ncbi:protein MAIN-LIKE 1-like [Trifolium pratense]|uniref:protein MAIN-LIKE 1-like n=1 Tax=Trifolium pratense TaxID=57577 RepID=UPI001E693C16|nr:protein MAIN-LIKE 1-like [Trifolium pratense]